MDALRRKCRSLARWKKGNEVSALLVCFDARCESSITSVELSQETKRSRDKNSVYPDPLGDVGPLPPEDGTPCLN